MAHMWCRYGADGARVRLYEFGCCTRSELRARSRWSRWICPASGAWCTIPGKGAVWMLACKAGWREERGETLGHRKLQSGLQAPAVIVLGLRATKLVQNIPSMQP